MWCSLDCFQAAIDSEKVRAGRFNPLALLHTHCMSLQLLKASSSCALTNFDNIMSTSASMPRQTLPLPVELRLRIYQYLLTSSKPLLLYHDRLGRSRPMQLHPQILRLSKTIYEESLPVLYDKNIFQIDLSTEVVKQCTGGEYPGDRGQVEQLIGERRWDFFEDAYISPVIFQDSLSRLRHIEITTAHKAIWGSSQCGRYLSVVGKQVIPTLLHALSKDNGNQTPHPEKKTLKITYKTSYDDSHSLLIRNESTPMAVPSENEKKSAQSQWWETLESVTAARRVELYEIRARVIGIRSHRDILDDKLFEVRQVNNWTSYTVQPDGQAAPATFRNPSYSVMRLVERKEI